MQMDKKLQRNILFLINIYLLKMKDYLREVVYLKLKKEI